MAKFRGLICNNTSDFKQKEQLIHNHLEKLFKKTDELGGVDGEYTSNAYAGINGEPNIFTTDGKPILVEPKNPLFIDEMPKLPLNFQDLDTSIIDRNE
jgi:hypothetical protein